MRLKLFILISVCVLAIVPLTGCDQVTKMKLTRTGSGFFTEEEAVQLSRKALERAVRDPSVYELLRYDNTNLFARNVYDPNEGYVLWRSRANHRKGFTVHMEQHENEVVCEIVPFK